MLLEVLEDVEMSKELTSWYFSFWANRSTLRCQDGEGHAWEWSRAVPVVGKDVKRMPSLVTFSR